MSTQCRSSASHASDGGHAWACVKLAPRGACMALMRGRVYTRHTGKPLSAQQGP